MDVRYALTGLLIGLAMNAHSATIYKCMVNGQLEYSDKPCVSGGSVVTLNELAAPLATFDMTQATKLDYTIKSHLIKERIARHRHKIDQYTVRMNAALKKVAAGPDKHSHRTIKTSADQSLISKPADTLHPSHQSKPSQATDPAARLEAANKAQSQSLNKVSGVLEDQLGNIADAIKAMHQDTVSGQQRAVIERYSTLIKTEEFKIGLLQQELRDLRE